MEYKEVEIVRLNSTDKSILKGQIYTSMDCPYKDRPFISDRDYTEEQNFNKIKQYLYIVSDDEINEEDWVTFTYDLSKQQGISKLKYVTSRNNCKKIIATTNPELGLPTLLVGFIENYITHKGELNHAIIIDDRNPVFIELKLVQQKTYTTTEVINLISKIFTEFSCEDGKLVRVKPSVAMNWIKENLL